MVKESVRSFSLFGGALLVWLCGAMAYADVIYLKNGKVVLTERTWIEGDTVKYQTPAGTKTLARALVEDVVPENAPKAHFVRITPEDPRPPKSAPAAEKRRDRPVLLKFPVPEADKEISPAILAQLKKNLAEAPANAERRAELVTALNLRAGSLLLRGEVEEALNACKEALAQNPAHAPTLTNLAVIQYEKGAYGEAEEALHRVESLGEGRNATTYYLLGETYYAQDKIPAAIDAWQRALQMGPDRGIQERLEKARSEVKAHADLEKQATRHFILRYDKQVANAQLGEAILAHLETVYRELSRTLLDTPPETITVILYPDRTYFDITRSPTWSGARYDGKIRVPVKGITQLSEKLRATLSHELAHAFIALAIGDRCPAWFNEGIAQQVEGRRAREYGQLLAEARRKKKIMPLERISHSFDGLAAADAELAYAQAISATEYVQRKGGVSALREILERLRSRRTFNESLGEVVRLGLKDFERAWISSLDEISQSSF